MLSRRSLLEATTAMVVSAPLAQRAFAQATPELAVLNRHGRMVHEFYADLIDRQMAVRSQRLAAIKTPADAQAYVDQVRLKIRQAFGEFPEKTPLKPRISGVIDRDEYTIEKVMFESRPEFYVTANLYLPKRRSSPCPGVVGSCGHSDNGKAAEAYQSFCQGLARQGYVVLIFDPIGQGERLQYPKEDLSGSHYRAGTGEHLHGGNQQFVVGEFFGSWRAWDGIRALDYLLTRPEVDPNHIGITGNSGGGTMTMWLAGLESRWTMAAPSCAVTSFARNFSNELPTDTEQCPPQCLALGLDHGDFLAALAPKPVMILAQEKDFFDARGSEQTYAQLKPLWNLLGQPDNLQLHVGPDPHGYTQANREGMYGFFNRVTGAAKGSQEPKIVIETDATLQVTPQGQVAPIPARSLPELTRNLAQQQAKQRAVLQGAALQSALRSLLKLPTTADKAAVEPEYRIPRPPNRRGYPAPAATQYAVATEPGIEALVTRLMPASHVSRPPQGPSQCTLYVAHHSSDEELRSQKWLEPWTSQFQTTPFFACDVRGVGESLPATAGGAASYRAPYGCDYFYAAHGLMLDRPYAGQKTWDVLQVLAWLQSLGHREVHLVALGWGTIPATFAAVLSPIVTQVTLKYGLTSYQDLAETEDYEWPLSCIVPGILSICDLPDCYQALEQKQLQKLEFQAATFPKRIS